MKQASAFSGSSLSFTSFKMPKRLPAALKVVSPLQLAFHPLQAPLACKHKRYSMFCMLNMSVNEARIVTCIVNHAETDTKMLNILKNTRGWWGAFGLCYVFDMG
jgi:hypothetical protein